MRLLEAEDYPELQKPGREFVRNGYRRSWDPQDLQSFTPLRFAVPDALDHRGLALVVDPDVFAVSDAGELFVRDLEGKAIWCVARPGHNKSGRYLASSVMLLDCGKLPHWRFEEDLERFWSGDIDYIEWIELRREDPNTIGILAPEWNDFDKLSAQTKLLHTTKRRTQPWKTGLRVDYTLREGPLGPLPAPLAGWLRRMVSRRYHRHPNPKIEAYFYALLAELYDQGGVTREEIEREIALKHVRPDSLALIARHRGQLWPADDVRWSG